MMMTKQQFVDIIDKIKINENYIEELNTLSKKYDTYIEFENNMVNEIVNILKIIFDDVDYISWWIWEIDFGTKCTNTNPCIWDENDNPIDVSTPELFYDFLIENMNSKKECEV